MGSVSQRSKGEFNIDGRFLVSTKTPNLCGFNRAASLFLKASLSSSPTELGQNRVPSWNYIVYYTPPNRLLSQLRV